QPGWHVNAHAPSEDYLIPTRVSLIPPAEVKFSDLVYPEAKQVKFSFADKPLAVYEGTIRVTGRGEISASAPPGTRAISGAFSFQPCNDKQCLAPAQVPFRVSLDVSGAATGAAASALSGPASGGPGASRPSTGSGATDL